MAYDYNFFYDYDLPQTTGTGFSDVLGIILIIYGVFLLFALAFAVTSYVLHSVGLYSLAKRRGIRKAWLAWIPVGNMWILGSISDQYQYVAKGLIRNCRKVLLGVMIAIYILSIPACISVFGTVYGALTGEAAGVFVGTLMILLSSFLTLAANIIGVIFQYIAYHKLFASSDPNNAVAFLIIGIFIPVTLPFFVFACRKKDKGMPPRRQTAQPEQLRAEQDDFVL